jgi:hypothetical protein
MIRAVAAQVRQHADDAHRWLRGKPNSEVTADVGLGRLRILTDEILALLEVLDDSLPQPRVQTPTFSASDVTADLPRVVLRR